MIYLFDKDEKLIKIVRKSAVKTALQKYALTTERYVSDRLTVELKGLNVDELEQVEYMAIQTMEDAHAFHYFYVAQKSSDELTTLIGVQSGIEELRKSPVYDKRPKNAFARDVITDLLAGTNWQARFVGETTPHSTNFYYTSIFDALKKVCEVWDLEMQFFVEMNGNRIGGRYIDFKRRIGEAVGKRVVYGHNALQILQEVERTNIFTALVGRGKGEETGDGYGRKITFEDVTWSTDQGKPVNKPAGQKYLELPLMTRQYGIKNADGSMRPKIGFVDFSEEENPEVLIERTYRALVDSARPQLTLKTSSVYLKGVKIGDTIRVVRHDKKLDYDTRIFEITFNRLNNQSSDIKLGDRIGESNEAKVQTIADKAVEQFINNEFSTFVQNLPNHLPSADGFNNNWYGTEDPTVQYPGKVLINDIWFKPDPEHEGHKIMLRWAGEVWEEILRTYDSEALRDRIAEEVTKVNETMQAQSEEHDRQVADILAKAQSVEELANQAKTDAASAITQALLSKDEAVADARAQIATVSQALNTAKAELQAAIANDYVAKSTYTEDARGTTLKLNEIKSTADTAKQNLATYQETVDRKLTELTSNTRTLDGKIDAASAKVDTVAGQIRTELTRVEGKIPSDLGGRNYILKSDVYATSGSRYFDTSPEFIDYAYSGKYVTISLDIKGENLVPDSRGLSRIGCELRLNLSDGKVLYLQCQKIVSGTQPRERISVTRKIPEGVSVVSANKVNMYVQVGGTALAGRPKFELSSIPTDWSPAPEDINSELSSTKTLITQTAEGQTQLSNRLTTTQDKVSTAETKINQLIGDVSSKVSQTDYNTLTGRVDSAETAITQNAQEISKRLTSTQVDSAISAKGYQTKADVDSNITGRGYITSSALQPYALSTTVQNLVQETADSFNRTISETKALIPTEMSGNLILEGNRPWSSTSYFAKEYQLAEPLEEGKTYTFVIHWRRGSGVSNNYVPMVYYNGSGLQLSAPSNSTHMQGSPTSLKYDAKIDSWVVTFTVKSRNSMSAGQLSDFDKPNPTIRVYRYGSETANQNNIQSTAETAASFATLVKGNIPLSRWEPAYSELATVTALHSVRDTVDSHTRTIGAVGTAGSILDNVSKVTQTANGLVQEVSGTNGLKTQVSTLAGSYAIKNLTNSGTVLNQLNLNKDGSVKIDGKLVQITGTTYIQDGVISSAKIGSLDAGKITTGTLDAARIKANSIDGSKLVFDQAFFTGLTANEAYLRQLFAKDAFITQVQAVTLSANKISGGILTATNDAMEIDLNNANISFNENATINFNSVNNALVRRRGTHTGFLHFEDEAYGGVYAGIGVTSSGDGINSKSSGRFTGMRFFRTSKGGTYSTSNTPAIDQAELFADKIYFKHSFGDARGFSFNTTNLPAVKNYEMSDILRIIKELCMVYYHLSNVKGNWKEPNFSDTIIKGLRDSKAIEIFDLQTPVSGWGFR
ncbi:phage tail spike protein [Streptococcus suis]